MLEKVALHHELLFIGIDGLDECQETERRQTLLMIHNLLKASKTKRNIRVFLTSRKEKDIGISLRSASRLDIRPYHLEKDITYYVRVRTLELSKKFAIALERQRAIIADIARRSQGLWAISLISSKADSRPLRYVSPSSANHGQSQRSDLPPRSRGGVA